MQMQSDKKTVAWDACRMGAKKTHISTPQEEQPIDGIQKDKVIKAEVVRKRDHEYKPNKIEAKKSTNGQ